VNLVLPNQRATAVALSVFTIHLLGDAISPYLIGAVSDASSLAASLGKSCPPRSSSRECCGMGGARNRRDPNETAFLGE